MDQTLVASLLAATLVAASAAGVAVLGVIDTDPALVEPHAGANQAAIRHGMAGDHERDDPAGHESAHRHAGSGMDRPSFPAAEGRTPTSQDAQTLEEVSRIRIIGDKAFTPSNGVRSGSGTLDDPFVISGFYVAGDLYLQDTEACVVVRENYVGGQLTLNWNGRCVHVHHNFIRDLRVNENIRREGYATGGLLELNSIEAVGQLRHYDGEFRDNVVGPKTSRSLFDPVFETAPYLFLEDPRVANVDGFNQGLIHHNTFHGSVDLDFHGHHHGTGFFATHSHYHGDNESRKMPHDHSLRWTSVEFTDNRIVDPEGYGLRYDDRQHAADDRVASSEQEETLDEDHRHWTRIVIARNVVEGAPIWVDVFNADDDHHDDVSPGWFDLVDNTIKARERVRDGPAGLPVFGPGHSHSSALRIVTAKEVRMNITGNTLSWEAADKPSGAAAFLAPAPMKAAAIDIDGLRDAVVAIEDNEGEGFHYGVKAHSFDDDTRWWVVGSQFRGAEYAVYYDESVENKPEEP